MEKTGVIRFCLVCAIVVMLGSCGWIIGEEDDFSDATGSILVSLDLGNGTLSSRSFTTTVAKEVADVVEILVIPSASPTEESTTTILLDPDTELDYPVDITLEEGLYRVLVLIGDRSSDTGTLLAAGNSIGFVEVQAEQQTEVAISVVTVSHEIVISPSPVAGGVYTVDLTGDTGSPVVTLEESGSSAAYSGQFRLEEETGYSEFDITATGQTWSAHLVLDSPMTAGDTVWYFSGPYITYNDPDSGTFFPVEDLAQLRWRWLSCTVISDTSPLSDQVRIPVTFGVGATSLGLTITWPD